MSLIEEINVPPALDAELALHKNTLQWDVGVSAAIALALTTLSYAVGLYVHWLTPETLNWVEVFAVFTSYSCTWLCVKERRINYPIGAISSAAYAYLFYSLDLMSSAALNLYLIPVLIYGWIRWRRDAVTRPVTRIALKWAPAYVAVAVAGYLGASLLSDHFNGTMAWADSVILTGSILAQFLLDNKKAETWIMWAVVNVFAIYTYSRTGLPLVAFQYMFFLGNTALGYATWSKGKNFAN